VSTDEPYLPMREVDAEEKVRVIHIRESTAAVNWIAVSPLWIFFSVVSLSLYGAVGTIALAFAVIALPVLAFVDRAALVRTGMVAPPSPLWILLTPFVYLTLRWLAIRPYTGGGRMPLAVFTVCAAVIGGFCLIAAGLSGLTAVTEYLPEP
jgi:hypothetical protein